MLERLGYRDVEEGMAVDEAPPHAHAFALDAPAGGHSRSGIPRGANIDLHRSFHGIGASDAEFWRVVGADTDSICISGVDVDVPSEPARALLLALHASARTENAEKPLPDLDRALEQVHDEVWKAAHQLAIVLDAVPPFVAGLSMRARGVELLERLDLLGEADMRHSLYASGNTKVAAGLERLTATRGLAPKARLVARGLVPTPAFMRRWTPVARRGRLGLSLAYASRPFWLLGKMLEAFRAYARARRAARGG